MRKQNQLDFLEWVTFTFRDYCTDRLKREFKVGVNVGKPQVSYRESISTESHGESTFNKEHGGKVQFGHAKIKVEPTKDEDVLVLSQA